MELSNRKNEETNSLKHESASSVTNSIRIDNEKTDFKKTIQDLTIVKEVPNLTFLLISAFYIATPIYFYCVSSNIEFLVTSSLVLIFNLPTFFKFKFENKNDFNKFKSAICFFIPAQHSLLFGTMIFLKSIHFLVFGAFSYPFTGLTSAIFVASFVFFIWSIFNEENIEKLKKSYYFCFSFLLIQLMIFPNCGFLLLMSAISYFLSLFLERFKLYDLSLLRKDIDFPMFMAFIFAFVMLRLEGFSYLSTYALV